MSSISHNGDSISYTYDPDGIRTSKTVNGTTTKYHVMNGTLLGQTKGSDTIVFLYDEKANRYGFDYNGTKYYYIFNVQGDVIGILNQAGQKIVSYTYDPWGKVLSVDGSEASTIGQINPIRYRGYYYDTETGFYYLQSRYYDPITRRFLNADGIVGANQDAICYNLFAYCSNNPVNYCDPDGWFIWAGVFLVAGVLALMTLCTADNQATIAAQKAIRAAENQKAVERYQTTYRPRVNVYTSSDRNPQPAKINVEINSSSNNPNIHIEDSYLYQDTAEIEAIITIIQESPQYDPSVFTRTIASYSAEWQAHNVLYNIEIAIGTDFIKDRTESADLDNHDRAIKIWDFLGLEE